jgi:dipeptidase D
LGKISAFLAVLRQEIEITEPSFVLNVDETTVPDSVIDDRDTLNFIHAVYACPNGVAQMSDRVPGVVATSNNLARVITSEDSFIIQCLTRSQMESARQDLCTAIQCTFELAGGTVEMSGAYPGWVPDPSSPMLKLLLACYQQRFGKIPEIKVIHAGLECGIIGAIYPRWDMISFGPTIRFPHSPDEKVEISSVQKFWQFLVDVLASIPEKK